MKDSQKNSESLDNIGKVEFFLIIFSMLGVGLLGAPLVQKIPIVENFESFTVIFIIVSCIAIFSVTLKKTSWIFNVIVFPFLIIMENRMVIKFSNWVSFKQLFIFSIIVSIGIPLVMGFILYLKLTKEIKEQVCSLLGILLFVCLASKILTEGHTVGEHVEISIMIIYALFACLYGTIFQLSAERKYYSLNEATSISLEVFIVADIVYLFMF